jgi:hypothetical protein
VIGRAIEELMTIVSLATQQDQHACGDGERGQHKLDEAYMDERKHTCGDEPDGQQKQAQVLRSKPFHRFCPLR